MQLNPSEISDLIKNKIENFDAKLEAHTEGTVVSVTDGIVRVHGLSEAMQGEMLEFPGGSYGMALNLERDSVGVVMLGAYQHITEGDIVKCTGKILEVPVGDALLGRVVDALGNPIDGKGAIDTNLSSPIEKIAPGVIARQSVDQPVQIGLKSIDSMIPVGRGQRELIIGDRQTGKTAIAVDANVFMWQLAKNGHRLLMWYVNWKNTVRWNTPSSLLHPLQNLLLCSLSPLIRGAPWANTSVTMAKML